MAVTFYYSPFTSAIRVHWALEELGIPYEKVKLDLTAGDQKKPEFLEINPNGKVPTLVDDGSPYFESVGIIIHLGEKYGVERGLWPAMSSPLHGPAMSWTAWAAVTLGLTAARLMLNTAESIPAEMRHAGQAEQARKDLEGLLGLLEARLGEGPYLLGERFSLVETGTAADLWWFRQALSLDLGRWPRLQDWVTRCTERQAFKTVIAE